MYYNDEDWHSPTTDDNGVIKNKLGLTNEEELNKAERLITSYKLAQLFLNPGRQTFDVAHYLSIHKYLFNDIYPFAGEIRSEMISKRIPFCMPLLIYSNLKETLAKARAKVPYLTDKDKLLTYIPILYSDLDIIHPFREGNGRTLREFIRQYIDFVCKHNNLEPYYIDFSLLADRREEYINAVVKADAQMDYRDLQMLFTETLRVKQDTQKKEL